MFGIAEPLMGKEHLAVRWVGRRRVKGRKKRKECSLQILLFYALAVHSPLRPPPSALVFDFRFLGIESSPLSDPITAHI